MTRLVNVPRREFLKIVPAAGAGLVIGFRFGDEARADTPAAPAATAAAPQSGAFSPNGFLQIDADGRVTVWSPKSEMGQGVATSLPMILAEEIGADFARVRVEPTWFDARFGDQDTGGSSSVRTSYDPLRKAGAAARVMLLQAAATRLGVPATTLAAEQGMVIHVPTNRRLPFKDLLAEAAALPVPQDPPLKDPKKFTLVGRLPPRTDTPSKVDGSAVYGIDMKVPGMLYAAVALSPVFGGKMVRFDDAAARKVSGVRSVHPIRRGVAVVADSTWAAFKGRDALKVTWDEGSGATESTLALRARCEELGKSPGKPFRQDGDADGALQNAASRLEATYEAPFQAHAPMEPMNATAHVERDRCTIWAPTQTPGWAAMEVMKLTGLPREAIRLNITLLGGGFGRRIMPDFVLDAVEISKAAQAPIKMTWTRPEDLQHGYYRPFSHHRLTAALGEDGLPVAWKHRIVSTSISESMEPGNPHPESDELACASDLPYAIPNVRVEYAPAPSVVPRGWWRSVDASQNVFVVESFLDECAAAAKKDPLRYRLDLLKEARRVPYPGSDMVLETERLKRVIETVAERSGWGKPLPAGRGRGIAAAFSYRSYFAQVAEVEVSQGKVRVHRLVAAIDCGRVIHPGILASQIEGGAVFGLTAALKSGITVDRGRVVQSNFHDFEVLRLDEMPQIESHFIPSEAPPAGVGEPGVSCAAPAVLNAIAAVTGRRLRRLPVAPTDLAS
ncbi:MAG TPA: xanthine dehydrogenase family protein molybdopterin-binding subunit [Candidatus Polarisedimenticolia bacterium]|nr:xanthine dehydrogenase family protein molybdopterin-binding subunit [Candidatus Polarisedimenticolia bacterium]